jgi:hypothetical protein
METQKRKLIFCNSCGDETNHELVISRSRRREPEGEGDVGSETTYSFWLCLGCESGTLEKYWTIDGIPHDERDYFPRRSRGELLTKGFQRLPQRLRLIYGEIIEAYNSGLHVICAAGLRALMEGICFDQEASGENLAAKIDSLGVNGMLPENIVKNLHNFRFMGNEALHELTPPDEYELRLAIEIIEDLLNFLYHLDHKATKLTRLRAMRYRGDAIDGDS